jgi:hypothetical protein
MTLAAHIAEQASRVDRHPTEPQKEAGNYRKGHIRIHGMDVSIENPRGSFRSGIGADGKPWKARLPHHYGYIKRTQGADGDHVDVFVGPHHKSPLVYVIDQKDLRTDRFDEHKAFVGFASPKQVKSAYHDAFTDGRAKDRLGHLTEMTVAQFKDWLRDGDTTKPLRRAGGGRVPRAEGGLLSDADMGFGKTLSDADLGIVTPESKKPDFSWSQAITDIPTEIGKEASAGAADVAALSRRGEMGPIEGLLATPKAIIGAARVPLSLLTGPARSILGHGMANTEHAIGAVVNPKVAAQDNAEAMYETAKGDVDKALMAVRPAGVPVRVPVGSPTTSVLPNGATVVTQPRALTWQRPAVPPTVPIPQPETIGDFGVPLTEGEAAADASQIAAEQRALRMGEGEAAQRVARARMDARDEALADVRDNISRTLDPYGGVVAETPQEAAEIAQRGVQSAAENIRNLRSIRYDEMAQLPGEFHAGAFEGIGQRIRSDLSLGENPVIIDDVTTPIASRALRDIDEQIGSLRIQNRADPFGAPIPENITAVNLRGLDQARKRLVSFYKDARAFPPTADTRATQAVLRAFDDQVENAITQGLFSGDERALNALREARGLHSTYRRLFTPQGAGDDVGRAMQNILGRGAAREAATPTEIANYLYGTANIGAKGLSYRLAQRLREVLGETSPEWAGVKQGLWRRLTETPEGVTDWGPQRVANNINKFLNGDGQPLANRVFNEPERELMQRYANLMRRMVPPPGAVNYSNNLQWAAHFRDNAIKYISAIVGEKLGGPPGAIVGYGLGHATQPLMDIAKARKVARSMPTIAESMDRWDRAVRAASRRGLPSTPALSAATANLVTKLRDFGLSDAALRALQGLVPAGAQDGQQRTGVTTSSGQSAPWPTQRASGGRARIPFDDGGAAIGNPMGEVAPPAPDDGSSANSINPNG